LKSRELNNNNSSKLLHKLYHTPKAFEEAKKGEDDSREKREGD
jgi:hypothetical protein